jgi:glycosyltransferase involved in cell wall biosynthesis
VIHVITRLILGGAQENTLFTVEGLARRGDYRVTLVSGPAIGPEGDLVRRARKNGVDLVILPELRREILPLSDVLAFHRLCGLFRRERPDIVHTHSSKAGILGRAAARVTRVPCILHTIHGPSFHRYQPWLANLAVIFLERAAARWTHKLISVAEAMTEQFVAAGVAPLEKFVTIYSGMEVNPFLADDGARERIRDRLGIRPDELVVGKIARLFRLKGYEYVLEAAPAIVRKFPEARFLFVGDGTLRRSLERQARELGVRDRVIFAGLVEPGEIPAMIKAMDVVVHASLREGLARVLPQALLSGCPVVSFAVDGAGEVVRDGETGFLVEPKSAAGLADAIIRVLSDLPAARRMARRGRELFASRFSAERMVREIDALYRQLLSQPSRDTMGTV